MSDIVLSYAKIDQVRAEQLVVALRGNGWSVWWDKDIAPGSVYTTAIDDQLSAAKCVIVLWSDAAVRSDWVSSEAEYARGRGVLLPVLLDTSRIPVPFNVIQHADLSNWSGNLADSTFQQLLDTVRGLASGQKPESSLPEDATPTSRRRPESMLHLPGGFPLTRHLHGYSGRWKVKSIFQRWRNRPVGKGETVVFNGSTLLYLDPGGERGSGMQIGVLSAKLNDGYTESRYIGNEIIEARADKQGTVNLTIQVSHRSLVEPTEGTAPTDLGEDLLENLHAAPPFHLTLNPVQGKSRYLKGKHWYSPEKRPYQVAAEYWDYFDL